MQFRSHYNPCSWLLEVAEIHVVFMVQQVVHLCIKGVGRLFPCKASVQKRVGMVLAGVAVSVDVVTVPFLETVVYAKIEFCDDVRLQFRH